MKFDQSSLINYEYFFVAEKLLDAARKVKKSAKVGSAAFGYFVSVLDKPSSWNSFGLFFFFFELRSKRYLF